MHILKEEALEYHSRAPQGKLAVRPTKPCSTQRDLSLAYTPGVAVPCLEIERDPSLVYRYTGKGNLVAVVTNGTAVLGLGNIGAAAGKPVMEGKAVLFKRFADIDVFDIELDTEDPREIIRTCQLMEPTFGGINLEDIKAPECFTIEEELRRTMRIPVFHDDQHGTAIISGAAMINALAIVGKKIEDVRVVFNGAGASGISCAQHYLNLGVRREHIIMCDTSGVIYQGRTKGMNAYKARFAADTERRTLTEALVGADVFFGLSAGNCVTADMVMGMAPDPIIFALSNPDPEIPYDVAVAARPDAIVATGRSDYPNQVNNVLGFPFIFRGALDVRASTINEAMKLAATHALAELARADVPDSVRRAYGVDELEFGRQYIIPKPFDPRVLVYVSAAVALAAIESGVAQQPCDINQYREDLERRLGRAHQLMRLMMQKARTQPKRVVFPEGEERRILRACMQIRDEGIAQPVLLGNADKIRAVMAELHFDEHRVEIVDPAAFEHLDEYSNTLFELRSRKGVTATEAPLMLQNKVLLGALMVRKGYADALIAGISQHYPDVIRPALQAIDMQPGVRKVAGCYVLITPAGEMYFLADTTVNIDPTAEDLAEIAILTAETARRFDVEPRVGMLSFSNFGSTRHPLSEKVARAVQILREIAPDLMADGEMQADTAIDPALIDETYPFSSLKGGANVLIFPNLESGNVAYKLLSKLGGAETIGPILMGLSSSVHVLHRGAEVAEVVNMAAFAVVDAQRMHSGINKLKTLHAIL
ncbi:MAG: NADP-dependent malic enzyme [Bryobacteraceae bacterium]|nr:NADP-dependent malic enzyme [Bryobacteraceae bacterium]